MSVGLRGRWGRIHVGQDLMEQSGPGIVMRFAWVSGEEIQPRLPVDQRLSFAVMRDSSGLHRVVPVGGVDAFILNAALVGLSICKRTGLFDLDRVKACDFDRLMFQQRMRIRESMRWHPNSPSDLRVTSSARLTVDDVDVLPDGLGVEQNYGAPRWTVAELLRHGDEQARLWGIDAPDDSARIRCGLYLAALHAPLCVEAMDAAERHGLMRFVLFCNDYEQLPHEVFEEADVNFERVHDRLRRAVWPHLRDGTEGFDRWFYQQSDTVIGQIAKQKRGGRPVSREACREIRLRIILEAYQSVANCIHVAMEEVKRCLPIELNDTEAVFFDALYRRQAGLGDLSLIHVRERLRAIGFDPMTGLLEQFDPGVLLRLLSNHAEKSVKRRMADRRYKNSGGAYQNVTAPHEMTETTASQHADISDAIAAQEQLIVMPGMICNELGLHCDCEGEGSIRLAETNAPSETEVTLCLCCDECGWHQEIPLTTELRAQLCDLLANE